MQELTRSSQALQAMVMQVRMIPVDAVFMRFPRLVRDLSAKLGKEVELKLVGKDTELDRTVVEALGDPLVHLIRNSLDHGLEPPEERAAAGKPTTGTLEISARHAGGNVVIEVRDDGRGIDPAKVGRARRRARADRRRGGRRARQPRRRASCSSSPASRPPRSRATSPAAASAWTPCATMIRELGGEVTLTSEVGQGTVAQIRLPLTLAIMSALLVEAGGQPYAIPLDRVERTLRLADQTVRSVAGRRMLVLRDGVLPLLDGASALGGAARAEDADHAVIVRGQDRRLALAVTRLVGQRELVTRPLPSGRRRRAAVSGGAVLSDGRIALIVDCDARRPHRRALARPVSPPEPGARKDPTSMTALSDLQLDALRELANIGSGTAGTALSQMLGRSVDISVPDRRRRCRSPRPSRPSARPSRTVTGVAMPLAGDMDARRAARVPRATTRGTLCGMLGVEAGTEDGDLGARRDRQHPRRLLHQRRSAR